MNFRPHPYLSRQA